MIHPFHEPIFSLHEHILFGVLGAFRESVEAQSAVAWDRAGGDTAYIIDRVAIERMIASLNEVAAQEPLVLIAEGIPGGMMTLPEGTRETACRWRVIIDPIDGTRGLMYQKRSAWILTGVAPNKGADTRLRDIELAVQTEIPLLKQHLADQLWAEKGRDSGATRLNILTGEQESIRLRPSAATDIAHGFASFVKFFPGHRAHLAEIDDDVMWELLGPPQPGKAACFEDQYASTAGQLYELMAGHDRFIADLRPVVGGSLCAHPYDICTAMIAEELGVILTGADGKPLDAPLDITTEVAWVGYANATLRDRIQPVLLDTLARHDR